MTYSFAKGIFGERGICAVAGLGIEPWVLYEVDKYSTTEQYSWPYQQHYSLRL